MAWSVHFRPWTHPQNDAADRRIPSRRLVCKWQYTDQWTKQLRTVKSMHPLRRKHDKRTVSPMLCCDLKRGYVQSGTLLCGGRDFNWANLLKAYITRTSYEFQRTRCGAARGSGCGGCDSGATDFGNKKNQFANPNPILSTESADRMSHHGMCLDGDCVRI